ncbi:hypothetical protein HUU05_11460 [candidate division KSB1 bacterium]|nr:hypothetical protein [candidate division KSB1 bacterium]
MKKATLTPRFVVCVKNEGYLASLEPRKIYSVLPDEKASKHGLIRVIDESGEDYLYPTDFFVPIEVPEAAEKVFALAA